MKVLRLIAILIVAFSHPFVSKASKSLNDTIAILMQRYQYHQALTFIDQQLEQDSLVTNLYLLKGNVLRQIYAYDKSIEAYKKAIQLDSLSNTAIIELANTYKMTLDYPNAQTCYGKALSLDTANFFLRVEFANCKYLNASDEVAANPLLYIDAMNEWLDIYQCDSTHYFTVRRLAQGFCKLDPSQGERFYKRAMVLNPTDASNVIGMSNLYISQKQFKKGIDVTTNFMMRDTTVKRVNSLHAYLLMMDKQYEKAINAFHKCVERGDTSRLVIKNLGISLFYDNQYEWAVPFLEKAYNQDTSDVNNLEFLGIACVNAYQAKKGVNYLEKALELFDPTLAQYTTVYSHLATACNQWANCPSAKRMAVYQKVAQLKPEDASVHLLMAYEYDYRKNYNKAIHYYQQYVKSKPKDDQLSGQALAMYRQSEERIKVLQAYVSKKEK
jgi:tetratricopeptide (TPR) repeat protein